MAKCSKHFSCLRVRQSVVNHPLIVSHAANCMCFVIKTIGHIRAASYIPFTVGQSHVLV